MRALESSINAITEATQCLKKQNNKLVHPFYSNVVGSARNLKYSQEEIKRWKEMHLRTQTRILPDHCCRYWNIASNGRAKSLKHILGTAMAKKKTLSNFC